VFIESLNEVYFYVDHLKNNQYYSNLIISNNNSIYNILSLNFQTFIQASFSMSNQEPSANEIKRAFVHPTQISKHLNCCICAEVFNDPVRSKCLHTFCRSCIEEWCQNHRGAASCPVCRKGIHKRDLGKDLLAF